MPVHQREAQEVRVEKGCSRGAGLVAAEVPCGVLGRAKEGLECQGEALRVLTVFDGGWLTQLCSERLSEFRPLLSIYVLGASPCSRPQIHPDNGTGTLFILVGETETTQRCNKRSGNVSHVSYEGR